MIDPLIVPEEEFGANLKGENLAWPKEQTWLVLFPVI